VDFLLVTFFNLFSTGFDVLGRAEPSPAHIRSLSSFLVDYAGSRYSFHQRKEQNKHIAENLQFPLPSILEQVYRFSTLTTTLIEKTLASSHRF